MLLTLPLIAALLAVVPPSPEALTETEQLRRQVVYLQDRLNQTLTERDLCGLELAPLRKQRDDRIVQQAAAKLKADLEAAHPGFTFNVETGRLDPTPPVAPTPKDR